MLAFAFSVTGSPLSLGRAGGTGADLPARVYFAPLTAVLALLASLTDPGFREFAAILDVLALTAAGFFAAIVDFVAAMVDVVLGAGLCGAAGVSTTGRYRPL